MAKGCRFAAFMGATDPVTRRMIEHDVNEKRQKPVGNAARYILMAFVPFWWLGFLAFHTPDWISVVVGAGTSTAILLVGFDLAADKR